MKNICFDGQTYAMSGGKGRPLDQIASLGINFLYGVPKLEYGEWFLFGCTNLPDPLPDYLSILTIDPQTQVGRGLDQAAVDDIKAWSDAMNETVKKDTTPSASTWMSKTGGYVKYMTLRDEFAGRAMPEIYQRVETGGFERVAKLSYELADAMLKAREQ